MVTYENIQILAAHMDNSRPGIIAKPGPGIIAKNICTVHKRCKTLAEIIDDCVNMDMDNLNCPKLLLNWYRYENSKNNYDKLKFPEKRKIKKNKEI